MHWFSRRSRPRYNGSACTYLCAIRRSARYLHPLSLASFKKLLVNNPYLTVALSLTSFVIRSVFASVSEAPCASLFRAPLLSSRISCPIQIFMVVPLDYDCSTIPGAHAERLPSRRGTGTAFADDDEGKTKVPNCSLSSRLVRSNRGPVSALTKWSADRDGDRGDDGEDDSDAEDIVTGAQCPRPNSWTAGWPSA